MPWCLVLPVVDGGGGGKPGSDGLLAGSMLLCVIWWIGMVAVLMGAVGMDAGLVHGGCWVSGLGCGVPEVVGGGW